MLTVTSELASMSNVKSMLIGHSPFRFLSPDETFKAKMHQIRFRLGSATDPAGGAYSAPPDPLAGFKGAYF